MKKAQGMVCGGAVHTAKGTGFGVRLSSPLLRPGTRLVKGSKMHLQGCLRMECTETGSSGRVSLEGLTARLSPSSPGFPPLFPRCWR